MTITCPTLNIEHMNYYKDLRLDELGITSLEEAEEMELELDVRFREFTPDDRMTWLRQNAYLEHYARTRTATTSARKAGVSVSAAKAWKRNDTLGFTLRLEISELEFSDRLQELALERASDPKAPATLLIELLRAYIPEKFSRNGHKCDTSKSDEILHRLREDAQREKAAGYPGLRAMVQRNAEQSVVDLAPAGGESSQSDLSPIAEETSQSDLAPTAEEIQRGGSSHVTPYDAKEAPTHDRPSPTRHSGGGTSPRAPIRGRYPEPAPTSEPNHFQDISSSPDTPEDSYRDDYHAEAVRPDDYPPFDTEDDLAFFDLTPNVQEPSHPDLSPAGRDTSHSDLSPAGRDSHNTNLSPAGGEIQRGGPSRAERRERLRQQRKREKKNTFPVVRF